jgi:hypothetical protein
MKRELDFSKARRGALVPRDSNKTRVTISLDKKLVDYLQSIVDRAGGGSYEDFVNELLCQRVLSSRPEVRGIKSRLSKNGAGQDKLFTALTILDTGEVRTLHSGRPDSTGSADRRVQSNKKTHGGKPVRLFDFDS